MRIFFRDCYFLVLGMIGVDSICSYMNFCYKRSEYGWLKLVYLWGLLGFYDVLFNFRNLMLFVLFLKLFVWNYRVSFMFVVLWLCLGEFGFMLKIFLKFSFELFMFWVIVFDIVFEEGRFWDLLFRCVMRFFVVILGVFVFNIWILILFLCV